jgi:cytoskeletal protein CcmA (bactofilin family)
MGMFRQTEPAKAPTVAPVRESSSTAARQATLIAPGCKIIGKVTGTAEVLIEGEIEGDVDLQGAAHVGAQGKIRGNISARTVRVAGEVSGNVKGSERVEVLASGQLEGDVTAPRVVISEGAFVKGKIEMTGQKSGDAKAPKA